MKNAGWYFLIAVIGLAALVLQPRSDAASPELETLSRQVAVQEKRITELEKRVQSLEGALRVTASEAELRSTGVVTVRGALLKLNGGGKPVARVDDSVQVTCPAGGGSCTGKIISGSPTVTSN